MSQKFTEREFTKLPAGAGSVPTTTKGDISGYSTTQARIPVGTDAQLLSADDGEATGLKWVDAPTAVDALNDISDVSVPAPTDGDVLRYFNDPTQFVPVGGANNGTSIGDHTDTYDDNTGTYYQPNGREGKWIYLDFGGVVNINRITYLQSVNGRDFTTIRIDVSDNATDWVTHYTPTGMQLGLNTFVLDGESGRPDPIVARYVRWYIIEYTTSYANIHEIEYFNDDPLWANDVSGVPAGGTAGQMLIKDTATDYDTSWQDAAAGGGSDVLAAFSGVRVNLTSDHVLATTATWETIDWDAADYDTDDYWEGVTNPSRFTAPVAGYYRVSASIAFETTASATDCIAGYQVNGSYPYQGTAMAFGRHGDVGTSQNNVISGTDVVYLDAGDYVEIGAQITDGTTRNIRWELCAASLVLLSTAHTTMFDLLHSQKQTADTPDDEFESSTLDGKWTAVTGSSGTVDFLGGPSSGNAVYDLASRSGWMMIQGNNVRAELRQDYTLPDGASMVAALSAPALYTGVDTMANNNSLAVFSLNDTDTGFNDGVEVLIGLETDANGYYIVARANGSAVAATNAVADMGTAFSGGVLFFRFTREGLVYHMHYSLDGSSWTFLDSYTASGALTNVWLAGGSLIAGTPAPICGWNWVRQGTNDLDPWNPLAAVAFGVDGWGPWIDVNGGIGFSNSWVNFGGSNQNAEYRKHFDGMVQLRGLIKDGTIDTAAFTLPSGYRPELQLRFSTPANQAFGETDAYANGDIRPKVGSTTWVALDGIMYDSTGGS